MRIHPGGFVLKPHASSAPVPRPAATRRHAATHAGNTFNPHSNAVVLQASAASERNDRVAAGLHQWESQLDLAALQFESQLSHEKLQLDSQLEVVTSSFESRLQLGSLQLDHELDVTAAQQEALKAQLTQQESAWFNTLAGSYVATIVSVGVGKAVGLCLPYLLFPFATWAALSGPASMKDLVEARHKISCSQATAQAKALADLEACRSQAVDGLAALRPEPRLNSLERRSQAQLGIVKQGAALLSDLAEGQTGYQFESAKQRVESGLGPAARMMESQVQDEGERMKRQLDMAKRDVQRKVERAEGHVKHRLDMLRSTQDDLVERSEKLRSRWLRSATFITFGTAFAVTAGGTLDVYQVAIVLAPFVGFVALL